MNITSLFCSSFDAPLLFNTEGEKVVQSWNSHDLYKDIAQISNSLLELGIHPEDRVLILTGNSVETFALILATFNIGAIAVPVNPYIGHDVLIDIVREMSPKVCFFEGGLSNDLRETLDKNCQLFIALKADAAKHSEKHITYSDLLTGTQQIKFGDFAGNHPALVIHTSGSQGRPKVIQMSHENLLNYFHYHDLVHRQFADTQILEELQKPLLSVFQPSHLASLSIALQGLLMNRPTYLLGGFLPKTYLKLLSKLGCRLSLLVPSMYVNLLQEEDLIAKCDFSSLELCCAIGEPCSEALAKRIEQAFGATLFSGYGLTECLPGIAHSWEDFNQNRIAKGSSGKVLFEEVKLVDREGHSVNRGELWIRNPTVHPCYADESLNQAKIGADGWFKTGDLFYEDDKGRFFHKGRIDDMFVCNGKNIYPAEIESALMKHSAIENVVACGLSDQHGKHIPAVLVQAQSDLVEGEVLAFFLKTGPLHAIPKIVKVVSQLPELGPGKKDRLACRNILEKYISSMA